MPQIGAEVWITGVGLISSLGEGVEAHWSRLRPGSTPRPVIDAGAWAPYAVHPLAAIDFSRQIRRTSDLRQMERWQRIGVHAAGLALADAGLAGDPALLDRVDLAIAAGNGERDEALDGKVLETLTQEACGGEDGDNARLNAMLMAGLRPTLYLGQLSNLLAGNISIVHKAAGSSRTFKGEEMAGVDALQDAFSRLRAGQSAIILAGGALNAERNDLLLNLELGGALLRGGGRPVWDRHEAGGGMRPGSVGSFLVLESADHARRRGARPYAKLTRILSAHSPRREPGDALAAAQELFEKLGPPIRRMERRGAAEPASPGLPALAERLEETAAASIRASSSLGVLSGASGVEYATHEEKLFLEHLAYHGLKTAVRAYGTVLGHGLEAHVLTGVALAAIAAAKGSFYAPFDDGELERDSGEPDARQPIRQILVTAFGHWRGEALAMVEAVGDVETVGGRP